MEEISINQKSKTELYNSLGGINSKVSPYLNGPLEFLDIKNLDFQTPGALTARWGSTMYVGQTFAFPVNSIFEFNRLGGFSQVIIGHTGGFWFGATTGQSQGASFTDLAATLVLGSSGIPLIAPNILGGIKLEAFPQIHYLDDPNTKANFGFPFTLIISANALSGNPMNTVTFVDNAFMADGRSFTKFNGITSTPNGLFQPTVAGAGATVFSAAASVTVGIGTAATLGIYVFYASYVNNRGFQSQIWPIGLFYGLNATSATIGGSFIQAYVDLHTPQVFGISSINLYSYFTQSSSVFPNTPVDANDIWNAPYVFLANYPASSGSTTRIPLGTTTGNFSALVNNVGPQPDPVFNEYQIMGAGITYSFDLSGNPGATCLVWIDQLKPKFVDVFTNRLFASGFTGAQSTVQFSDTKEPEGYFANNNFEARTNDGDIIVAQVVYLSKIYFFKRNSFHGLIGDSASNFSLQEVSTQYGALNDRCIVEYDDILMFLDRNGIMQFNGANLSKASGKIQPIIDRMNYSVAVNTACAAHDKLRNQVMFAIPVDGSTVNNLTLVFDYLAGSWTTYDGFIPTAFAQVQGRNNSKNVFYGTSNGMLNWFGPSFVSDNGAGFTTYFKSHFLADGGNSITKQFRRLYFNTDIGTTFVLPINFFQDYGSSRVLQSTLVMSEFQQRFEFGIPAKAIAFEIFNLQTTSRLKIFGFTIESRLQRRV